MDKPITDPTRIRKKQRYTLWAGLGVFISIFLGVYCLLKQHAPPPIPKENEGIVHFETPLNHVDTQMVWLERTQNQLTQETKAREALNQQLQLLQQDKEMQNKTAQDQAQTLQNLQAQVDSLQKKLAHHPREAGSPASNDSIENNEAYSISDHAISLITSQKRGLPRLARTPLSFVPAGTFVRAISLGGADASAGVTSQGNPSPMLFRLLDPGTLPNHRQSQLKACIATAAVVGDVSSERGEIRLERLSCTRASGQIVEIPVEATIFGPDGKNGLRGNPLWRERALLQRAFAAGTLSGLSNSIGSRFTSTLFNGLGGSETRVDPSKILQYGATTGLSNAAEKLAEYNVKRAEQYHPVIQLSAGIVVDIVFLKGFYLDGRKVSDNEPDYLASTTPNKGAASNHMDEPQEEDLAPLPLTPKQIESLKQKNEKLGYL